MRRVMILNNVNKYTRLKLEPRISGYLYFLLERNEISSIHEIINILVAAYVENYAEENGLDMKEVDKEALRLYTQTRKPQTKANAEKQKNFALQSVKKLKTMKDREIVDEETITAGTLEGNF